MHRFFVLGILPLVFVATAIAQESQPVRVAIPVYQGKVVDEKGQPLAGATVTAQEAVPDGVSMLRLVDLGSQTTGTDGKFRFAGKTLGARGAIASAMKEGLAIGWATMPADTPAPSTITLAASPQTLEGVVVDETGKPIPGASVCPVFARTWPGPFQGQLYGDLATGWLITRTDAAGKFKYANLPEETTADFIVSAPGRETLRPDPSPRGERLQYAVGQKDIRLTLPPEGRITGVVVDKATGQPLEGVTVLARPKLPQLLPPLAKSGKDGRFSFGGLAAEEYLVTIVGANGEPPAWVSDFTTANVEAGQSVDSLRIEAVRGGLLEVTVVNAADSTPQSGATVMFYGESAHDILAFMLPQLAITNEQGLARLRLPPGKYNGSAGLPGVYVSAEKKPSAVTIQEGKTEQVTLKIKKAPRLICLVQDSAGQPVAGAKGTTINEYAFIAAGLVTDAAGRVDMPIQLYPADSDPQFTLLFRHVKRGLAGVLRGGSLGKPMQVTLKPGQTLKGLVAGPDGTPIAKAAVTLRIEGALGSAESFPPDEDDVVTTDAQGRYELTAIPLGWTCDLQVRAEGYKGTSLTVRTPDQEGETEVRKIVMQLAQPTPNTQAATSRAAQSQPSVEER